MVRRSGTRHARGVDLVDPTLIDVLPHRRSGRRRGRLLLWLAAGLTGSAGAMLLVGDEIGGWWAILRETLANPELFRAWVEGLGAWGPIGYLLAQAAQVVVIPIPGTLFPPVGALAFGPWPAFGLSLAGQALGSALVFLLARKWGRPLAVRVIGVDRIRRYENSDSTGRPADLARVPSPSPSGRRGVCPRRVVRHWIRPLHGHRDRRANPGRGRRCVHHGWARRRPGMGLGGSGCRLCRFAVDGRTIRPGSRATPGSERWASMGGAVRR
jgi:hypothetical protein